MFVLGCDIANDENGVGISIEDISILNKYGIEMFCKEEGIVVGYDPVKINISNLDEDIYKLRVVQCVNCINKNKNSKKICIDDIKIIECKDIDIASNCIAYDNLDELNISAGVKELYKCEMSIYIKSHYKICSNIINLEDMENSISYIILKSGYIDGGVNITNTIILSKDWTDGSFYRPELDSENIIRIHIDFIGKHLDFKKILNSMKKKIKRKFHNVEKIELSISNS